ncbi:non-ribosomal peptide synthetase [Pseudoalteromonas denitrificans]|uniref:Non-ribosomal peptide synthase domain TIGR01720/amino acid adenylation domain-containing protein n=1 Tax=Pseudoalteromonas denitrificans DSM 6059 TaxID=1123010 RepID=A0A1I1DZ68_9GAMM|nr:non-ribosomal peptide synthetase [Pseudoalteromonas denitrificans]SFB79726.1 non-ribosomal peptide synthase domain TIGR01720/amino acid adenylation domain-containing protein [Pseudoalteromonas denitrificans DSM 6059]
MGRHAYFEKFEDNAIQYPDSRALNSEIIENTKTITVADSYRDLNRWSNALANQLIEVNSVSNIGIYIDSQASYVAALLACGKAGKCFVPLDVNLPDKRLNLLIEKANIETIVTNSLWQWVLEKKLPTKPNVKLISADRKKTVLANPDYDENLNITVKGSDACYIMFTSGSSGEPKAVVGQHKSLVHFLDWETECFDITQKEVVSWLAPTTFDVSLRDILLPLINGACLAIPQENTRMNVAHLLMWLEQQVVTHIHTVPSIFRLLTQTLSEQQSQSIKLPALRRVLLAGEPLYYVDVKAWRAAGGEHIELVNLYGPTETTLAKLFYRIDAKDNNQGMVPIGQTLPKTHALLIQGDRLCNSGEIGEIYIRTPYRSLGYLNDNQETRKVFIQSPLQSQEPDILYKTGDLGRYQDDGLLMCLGRLDNQVKINGVRIELGEIEAACKNISRFKQVVVQAIAHKDKSKFLCCYYVRHDGLKTPLPVADLRLLIGERLPDALVPNVYVCLTKLPTLLNGKINRKALPAPEEVLYAEQSYTAPQTDTEEKLCELWAECLCLTKVCTATEFLDLGGDSFKMIRVLSAIFKVFGKEISLKLWLQNPTIKAVAVLLDGMKNTRTYQQIPLVKSEQNYAVTTAQSRLWTLYQMGVAPVAYNLPEAYFITGTLDITVLQQAFQDLVERHESLRTIFFEQDKIVYQRILPKHDFELSYQELSKIDDDILAQLIHKNQNHSFDLQNGPLMRAELVKCQNKQGYVLLFNIHHIICDGWSLNVLVNELAQNYQTGLQNKKSEKAPLKLQFKDFVAWQKSQLDEEKGLKSRNWWLNQLAAPIPVLDLPCDYPRPPVQSFNGNTHQYLLPMPIFNKVNELAKRQGITLFVLLNAAVKILLYRYTNQSELIIGSPVVGRAHPDLDEQIGYYVNTLPLRDKLNPESSITDCLQQVHESTSMALEHQQFPFDELINDLDIPRDMGHSALFDVMLVLQNMDLAMPELQGVQFNNISKEQGWNFSRYDLVFHFQPDESGLLIDINYNSDIFKPIRIANCAQHLTTLLENMAEHPEQSVDDIGILPESEKALLRAYSQGQKRIIKETTIIDLFFEKALQFQNQIALEENKQKVTYASLAKEVTTIAKGLVNLGVKPGVPVALLIDRSTDSIIALLAIMASGGVYLPLDGALPEQRLKEIISSSGCDFIIKSEQFDFNEVINLPANIYNLQEIKQSLSIRLTLLPKIDAHAPAYMIYTSGSTGKPKGVLLRHAGFVNMSLAQIEQFGINSEDKVLQFASLSFDASLANIFMSLFSGASLVLINKATIEQPQRFLNHLNQFDVSVATLPPAYLRALDRPELSTLKILITAGEPANFDDAAYYSQKMQYFNAYGPTEVSVCATIEKVTDPSLYNQSIPIGKPLANVDVFVLGKTSLAPVGVPGELCIMGEGLALEYRNNEYQTQNVFTHVPASISDCTEFTRMYKTGDMAYWNELGQLIFIGRNDKQVKINAFRIDTSEVENSLLALDEIEAAFVDTVKVQGENKLAAWVVAKRQAEIWPSVAEFYVYDDVLYGSMAQDFARNDVYFASFKKHLKDKVVLEIGPGPEVVLSRLAIAAGAKKVYAVELLPETYRKACAKVEALGLSDKIIVINSDVQSVSLPEKADWCISEIVGSIGGSEGAAKIINNSRHLLHQSTNMLPQRSLTSMAAVSLSHENFYQGFTPIAAHYVNEIFNKQGHAFDLRLCIKNLPQNAIISNDGVLEDLDYTQDINLEEVHDTQLNIHSHAQLSGLIFWLQLYVDADNYVDSLYAEKSWLPIYLPLFGGDTVSVAPGDVLKLKVIRTLCENGLNPDFEINGDLINSAGEYRSIHGRSAHFGNGFAKTPFYQKIFQLPSGTTGELPMEAPIQAILQVNEVRNLLAKSLPHYAVPHFISVLDQFPLTSNGKIDTQQLPAPQAQNVENFVASTTPVETAICKIWQQVLGINQIGVNDNFFSLGGDSISAIQIVAKMSNSGMLIDTRDIFQNPVVAQLALTIEDSIEEAEQGLVCSEFALTPIQQWAFSTLGDKLYWFNQACMLRNSGRFDNSILTQAITLLITQHDMLRASFVKSETQVVQKISDLVEADIEYQQWQEYNCIDEIPASACDEWHKQFSLNKSLFRAVVLQLKDYDVLVLVANHLVIDTVSWRIIIEDMQTFLASDNALLPNKTDDFGRWSAHLKMMSQLNSGQLNESYWKMLIDEQHTLQPLNHLNQQSEKPYKRTIGNSKNLTFNIEHKLSSSLSHCVKTSDFTLEQVFLTALGHGLQSLTGNAYNLVTMESHGRNTISGVRSKINISRTVGWFTYYYPLPLSAFDDISETLERTKMVKERIPDQGMAYLLLRWLKEGGEEYQVTPKVSFNYLGEFKKPTAESSSQLINFDFDVPGCHQHPDIACEHSIDWLMMFTDEVLSVSVSYGKEEYTDQDIARLATSFKQSLQQLDDYLTHYNEQRSTTGQFTVEGLTDTEFDTLFE